MGISSRDAVYCWFLLSLIYSRRHLYRATVKYFDVTRLYTWNHRQADKNRCWLERGRNIKLETSMRKEKDKWNEAIPLSEFLILYKPTVQIIIYSPNQNGNIKKKLLNLLSNVNFKKIVFKKLLVGINLWSWLKFVRIIRKI